MSVGVLIRAATVSDAPAIASLLGELGYPADPEDVAGRLLRLEAEAAVRSFVAELEGEVVGYAGLRIENLIEHGQPACRMTALVVGAAYRRRGVGATLADAVETFAREAGCRAVVLTSGDHRRELAHPFYRRLGYEATGRRFIKPLG